MALSEPHPPRLKVLVVDDNDDARFLLTYLIANQGYDVEATSSKEEALRAFARSPADLLVSDIGLPDGTGNELLRELAGRGARPYAIAISGFGTRGDVEATRAAGFRHHLVKPIQFEQLQRLLQEATVGLPSS